MNVKRYLGKDINEAMAKVRREMGREAVILHTRKIKSKGIKGLFKKPLVEVVAAIDENKKPTMPSAIQAVLKKAVEEEAQKAIKKKNDSSALSSQTMMSGSNQIGELKAQMNELKKFVQNALVTNAPSQGNIKDTSTKSADLDLFENNDNIKHLIDNNVDRVVIDKIKQIITKQINISEQSQVAFKNSLRVVLRDMLGVPYIIDKDSPDKKIYFFVGPTGVGKTTTLAKIAAKLALVEGKRVALITADTYRIAAVEQLKTYSEILSVPLDVVYEADEISDVIKRHNDKDYILIDTAGRNHKSEESYVDLKNLIDEVCGAEVFLVMSLTSSKKDITSILKSYSFIKDYKLIFTKLDEAEAYGNLINAKSACNRPLSFITNGQSVPDDIIVADSDKIAEMLLGE